MADVLTIERVRAVVGDTWFDIDAAEGGGVILETRDHGDVSEEAPGEVDLKEARRMLGLLRAAFKQSFVTADVNDEWVSIEIHPRKDALPEEELSDLGNAADLLTEKNLGVPEVPS